MKKIISLGLLLTLFFSNVGLGFAEEEVSSEGGAEAPVSEEVSETLETPAAPEEGEEASEALEEEENTSNEENNIEAEGKASSVKSSSSSSSSPYSYFNEAQVYNDGVGKNLKNKGVATVNEQRGEMSYEYTLDLPVGRKGLTPSLKLNYSNQNTKEETILGYGWGISENRITRNTKKGLLMYQDEEIMILELGGMGMELQKTKDSPKTYKAKNGDDTLKAVRTYTNVFEVYDQSGTNYTFVQEVNQYAWYLTKVQDLHGNRIMYEYLRENNQVYPQKIQYNFTNNVAETEIIFSLKSKVLSTFDASRGFGVTTDKEIEKIEIYSENVLRKEIKLGYGLGNNGKRSLLKNIEESFYDVNGNKSTLPKTEFEYSDGGEAGWEDIGTPSYSQPNVYFCRYNSNNRGDFKHTSVGLGVTPMDLDGDGIQEAVKTGAVSIGEFYGLCPSWVIDNGMRFGDINGDLLPDKVQGILKFSYSDDGLKQFNKVHINRGNSTWNTNTSYELPASIVKKTGGGWPPSFLDRGVNLIDINGDGLSDIVQAFDGSRYYYNETDKNYDPLEFKGRIVRIYINTGSNWEYSDAWTNAFPPYVMFSKYNHTSGGLLQKTNLARFVDINNDGMPDIVLRTGQTYIHNGSGWTRSPHYNLPATMNLGRPRSYNQESSMVDGGVHFVDLNGDGLLDIIKKINRRDDIRYNYRNIPIVDEDVYTYIYEVVNEAYLNTGEGWQKTISWDLPEETVNQVYLDHTYHGEKYVGRVFDKGEVFMDIDQDGLEDFLVSYVVKEIPNIMGRTATKAFKSSDYKKRSYRNKATKPDVLKSIKSISGAESSMKYQLSTKYANNKMPLRIMTLKELATKDNVGTEMKISYEYSDGHYYYEGVHEKGFAGFGKIEKTDTEGNKTVSYYHQGNEVSNENEEILDHKSLRGRKYKEEFYDKTGEKLTESKTLWNYEAKANNRFFPYVSKTLSTLYGENPRSVGSEYEYDSSVGAVTKEILFGEVIPGNNLFSDTGADDITQEYLYAENTGANVFGAKKEVIIKNHDLEELSRTRIYYDNSGLGSIYKGDKTKEEILYKEQSRYISTQYQYDVYGNPKKQIDPKGNTTNIVYKNGLYPEKIINAKGHTVNLEYDRFSGNITQNQGANKEITKYEYYPDNRIKEIEITPFGESSVVLKKYEYDDSVFPQKTTVENYVSPNVYQKNVVYYDGLGREIKTISEQDNREVCSGIIYNNLGQVKKEVQPYECSGYAYQAVNENLLGTKYDYDGLGRVTKTTTPLGVTQTEYFPRKTKITDPLNRSVESETDAYGRTVLVRNFLNNNSLETKYEYDELGNMTKITDAENNAREFSYDSLKRLIKSSEWHRPNISPNKFWNYQWDDNGNLTSQSDPKTQNISFVYDVLNRLVTKNTLEDTENYYYDTSENGIGKISELNKADFKISYKYNKLGHVKEEIKTIEGESFLTQTETDVLGKVESIKYPDGTGVSYNYNKLGNVKNADYKKGSEIKPIVTNIEYTILGQIKKIKYANGSETTNTYNPSQLFRLVEKKTVKNNQVLQSFGYSYDAVGNITTIADTVKAETIQYTYDDINRLINSTVSVSGNTPPYTRSYQYDNIGNITYKSDIGVLEYNHENPQIVTKAGEISFEYDVNGNRLNDGETTYIWDSQNQLIRTTKLDDGKVTDYKYDTGGGRTLKVHDGDKSVYVNKMYEKEEGDISKYIFAGNQRVASIKEIHAKPNTPEYNQIEGKIETEESKIQEIRTDLTNYLAVSGTETVDLENAIKTQENVLQGFIDQKNYYAQNYNEYERLYSEYLKSKEDTNINKKIYETYHKKYGKELSYYKSFDSKEQSDRKRVVSYQSSLAKHIVSRDKKTGEYNKKINTYQAKADNYKNLKASSKPYGDEYARLYQIYLDTKTQNKLDEKTYKDYEKANKTQLSNFKKYDSKEKSELRRVESYKKSLSKHLASAEKKANEYNAKINTYQPKADKYNQLKAATKPYNDEYERLYNKYLTSRDGYKENEKLYKKEYSLYKKYLSYSNSYRKKEVDALKRVASYQKELDKYEAYPDPKSSTTLKRIEEKKKKVNEYQTKANEYQQKRYANYVPYGAAWRAYNTYYKRYQDLKEENKQDDKTYKAYKKLHSKTLSDYKSYNSKEQSELRRVASYKSSLLKHVVSSVKKTSEYNAKITQYQTKANEYNNMKGEAKPYGEERERLYQVYVTSKELIKTNDNIQKAYKKLHSKVLSNYKSYDSKEQSELKRVASYKSSLLKHLASAEKKTNEYNAKITQYQTKANEYNNMKGEAKPFGEERERLYQVYVTSKELIKTNDNIQKAYKKLHSKVLSNYKSYDSKEKSELRRVESYNKSLAKHLASAEKKTNEYKAKISKYEKSANGYADEKKSNEQYFEEDARLKEKYTTFKESIKIKEKVASEYKKSYKDQINKYKDLEKKEVSQEKEVVKQEKKLEEHLLDIEEEKEEYEESIQVHEEKIEEYKEEQQGMIMLGEIEEKLYYHHGDHLGSASVTTNESGDIVSDIRYYPYGATRSSFSEVSEDGESYEEKYKYNDKEEDETGLYYYGARYYDSRIGSWISNDPLQRDLGTMVKMNELNGYRYVMGNPMIYVDPTGEYNVKSGKIEKDDKEDDIVSAVNEAYGIETDWDTIADVSFFQDNHGTTEVSELVGEFTYVGTDYVKEISNELDSLNVERAEYAKETNFNLVDLAYLFRTDGVWDLKSTDDKVFGSWKDGGHIRRNYWAYIYKNELVRFDAPGNINFGYVSHAIGVSRDGVHNNASIEQFFTDVFNGKWPSFGDNKGDVYYMDEGYNLYE